MAKLGVPPLWIELTIDRSADELRVSARGSRGEQTVPRALGAENNVPALVHFASAVQRAAAHAKPLTPELLAIAQAFYTGLLSGEVGLLYTRLREAASGSLLVRLFIHDPDLQAVPFEASCKPGEGLGFWASSPELQCVRGVSSSDPWQPREVRGAVRILAIAPNGDSLVPLESALADRIATGEIEWLDPVVGRAARVPALFERLRREPIPHVLHFIGHGRVDNGVPALRLADDEDGEETWLQVELLAQQLKAGFQGLLRLVVIEACEGARPSAFASAAEILSRAGADAVVAHLWPVKAEVARVCSAELYRALAGTERNGGDIALAIHEARRAILGAFGASAEAFSPVLYLRGPSGLIFDFKSRKVAPPSLMRASLPGKTSGLEPSLARVLRAPFSLVLGDRWNDQKATLTPFREKLQKELAKANVPAPADLPMSALAQWFALHRGADKLGTEFQKAFRVSAEGPPIALNLARLLGPGIHTTLLRSPWLEQSLAEHQPERTIYVIQPGENGALVMKREGGNDDWEELDTPPDGLNFDREILILRPYGGYTPEQVFTRPLLTEDDYDRHLPDLWSSLPVDLTNAILRTLGRRPALLLGLSMHTGHHRKLLRSLYPRSLPRESLAVLEQGDGERKLWESGAGLPGKNDGVEVVEVVTTALCEALETMGEEGEP